MENNFWGQSFMLETLDWQVIGLTLNIVGIFFLANSLTFKRPKRALHEFFGVEKALPLRRIREHVLNKIQVYIGFTFLIAGYSTLIWVYLAEKTGTTSKVIQPNLLTIALILVVSTVLLTLVLKIVQFGWTRVTFKRLLIEFFREHQSDLLKNVHVAKEVGELLKIPRNRDDSIEDYVVKIMESLHIPIENEGKGSGAVHDRRKANRRQASPKSEQVHPATPPRIG